MLKRRRLLQSVAGAAVPASWLAGCVASAVPPPAPATASAGRGDATELALVNRLTWGVNGSTFDAWSKRSRRDAIDAQLHPPAQTVLPAAAQAQIDAMTIRQRPIEQLVPELDARRRANDTITDDDAKKAAQQAYQQELSRLAREAATRSMLHALYSPDQLREQLTWFWFNHFNVHQHKANLRVLVGDYEEQLRQRSLGRFRDLLIASATHAAMIRYLDNELNAANHINENFAREVMELHTLGVDGGYTQKDVQDLARVLTGLGVNPTDRTPNLRPELRPLYVRRGLTEFNPARHDGAPKRVLGENVDGRGWDEIMGQLARLARHPATSRHVCRKLAVHFVADAPPGPLVERMARAFDGSDGDIAVTLRALFDAPEFTASLGRKFKDPVHYVVSAVRLAYDGKVILNAGPMINWANRLGEGLYNRQTPDGYPLDEAAWSSSGQLTTRFEIARAVGSGQAGLFRSEGPNPVEQPAFPQLANALYFDHLARTLSPATRGALEATTSPQEWNVVLLSSPDFMLR